MKDFIFIIGPSAVGKTTLAKKLFENYKGVYIEQNMVPEFKIPEMTEDEGIFEEKICWENILEQLWFFYKNNFRNIIAFSLIYGGLLGNLVDRLIYGYVIDYFKILLGSYDFPIFNLADMAIVIGFILLIYAIIKGEDKHDSKSRTK